MNWPELLPLPMILRPFVLWLTLTNTAMSAADFCDNESSRALRSTSINISAPGDTTNVAAQQECHCVVTVTSGPGFLEYTMLFEDRSPLPPTEDFCGPVLYVAGSADNITEYALCAQTNGGESLLSTTRHSVSNRDQLFLYLFNTANRDVSGRVDIQVTEGEFNFTVKCDRSNHNVSLPHCPCGLSVPVGGSDDGYAEDWSLDRRLLVGFMAAILFLLVVGLLFLLRWKLKRKGQASVSEATDGSTGTVPVPTMFHSDNPAFNPYDEVTLTNGETPSAGSGALAGSLSALYTPKTPRATTGNSIYAEIGDTSLSSSQLPFTPNPELRLGLQKPDNYQRATTDSGLYSTPSEKRAVGLCDEAPYALAYVTSADILESAEGTRSPTATVLENPYAIAYATSNEVAGTAGSTEKPSTPAAPSLSSAEIEALYAKPNKVKKQFKQSADQPPEQPDRPPELPPGRPVSNEREGGDITLTNESVHNMSKETIETDV